MKHPVTTFVSMNAALKELEKFIRDGNHLETGKPFKSFGNLRSRELFGNWLICAAVNSDYQSERMRICSDPNGGDGVIYDRDEKKATSMEHVLVSKNNNVVKDIEDLIIDQINMKRNKGGKAYATGKSLVVFLNRNGKGWIPRNVLNKLPNDLYFDDVWIVGLHGIVNQEYLYNVVLLDKSGCPMWKVKISSNFESWSVKRTN